MKGIVELQINGYAPQNITCPLSKGKDYEIHLDFISIVFQHYQLTSAVKHEDIKIVSSLSSSFPYPYTYYSCSYPLRYAIFAFCFVTLPSPPKLFSLFQYFFGLSDASCIFTHS